eukprot:TRINITY_DN576_c0_g1_i1.p1 TRINITY_DN576_c0_g1~~TRINITY_DN576_c0_g1_i1.p1  ORF type:complete len:597 (+),score=131.74 TRINITY_DN576_c0_g1_i1:22-1812(+)
MWRSVGFRSASRCAPSTTRVGSYVQHEPTIQSRFLTTAPRAATPQASSSWMAMGLGIAIGVGGVVAYTARPSGFTVDAASGDWSTTGRSPAPAPPPPPKRDGLGVLNFWGPVIATLGGAGFVTFAISRYRRCPSNQILVVQGKVSGRSARCMHGGGTYVWPIFQEFAYLSLEPLQIEAPLKKALSLENIRVNVPAVFTIAVGTEEKIMENAAKRLLGLSKEEVKLQAQEIIFGQLRQIIASMKIDDINKSRDQFVSAVASNIENELNKIGLILINVNITDITDESGYLESIGRKAAQEAVQRAEVDVSEQQKMGAIGVAENKKETALSIAALAKDQRVGEAKANSEAIQGENEAKVLIAESNALLQIKSASAYKEAESRKKEAEAFVKEAQARAEAKAARADAERVEAEKTAELVSPATAQKAETLVRAQAAAEQVRLAAAAEAEALYVRLEAQARGEFEVLQKKAEGMRLMVASAGSSKEAFQMLMLEHVDHLAKCSSEAIRNIKFDKIVVWDNNSNGGANGDGSNATANFLKGIATALPPAMHMMKDIGGVDLPKYFGSLAPEQEQAAGGQHTPTETPVKDATLATSGSSKKKY